LGSRFSFSKTLCLCLAVLLFSLALPSFLFAQVSGSISGAVLDPSGPKYSSEDYTGDQTSQVSRETISNGRGIHIRRRHSRHLRGLC